MQDLIIQCGALGLLAVVLIFLGKMLASIGTRVADGITKAFNDLATSQKTMVETLNRLQLEDERRARASNEALETTARANRHDFRASLMVVQENLLRETVEARDQILAAVHREQREAEEVVRNPLKQSMEGKP